MGFCPFLSAHVAPLNSKRTRDAAKVLSQSRLTASAFPNICLSVESLSTDAGPPRAIANYDINCDFGDGDIDNDGIPDEHDDDMDGDGITNDDDDVDGDGIPNKDDADIDGDGIPNDEDDSPYGKVPTIDVWIDGEWRRVPLIPA